MTVYKVYQRQPNSVVKELICIAIKESRARQICEHIPFCHIEQFDIARVTELIRNLLYS